MAISPVSAGSKLSTNLLLLVEIFALAFISASTKLPATISATTPVTPIDRLILLELVVLTLASIFCGLEV